MVLNVVSKLIAFLFLNEASEIFTCICGSVLFLMEKAGLEWKRKSIVWKKSVEMSGQHRDLRKIPHAVV